MLRREGLCLANHGGEIALIVICSVLLLAIAVPAAWATEQWMEGQSQRIYDHMMILHEPIESWNR